jgi:hypothetical protein
LNLTLLGVNAYRTATTFYRADGSYRCVAPLWWPRTAAGNGPTTAASEAQLFPPNPGDELDPESRRPMDWYVKPACTGSKRTGDGG